jgi:hypothetical protein
MGIDIGDRCLEQFGNRLLRHPDGLADDKQPDPCNPVFGGVK